MCYLAHRSIWKVGRTGEQHHTPFRGVRIERVGGFEVYLPRPGSGSLFAAFTVSAPSYDFARPPFHPELFNRYFLFLMLRITSASPAKVPPRALGKLANGSCAIRSFHPTVLQVLIELTTLRPLGRPYLTRFLFLLACRCV